MEIKHKSLQVPKTIWTNPLHFIAFGFGTGALPIAPGTWGTLAAIPLYLLMRDLSLVWYVAIVTAATVFGIWLCDYVERQLNVHDHRGMVWDEICGYGITMIAAPKEWYWIVVGFLLFRLFDIWKPWPISWIDKQVSGGLGVMLDDVLAAIYALIGIQFLARFLA